MACFLDYHFALAHSEYMRASGQGMSLPCIPYNATKDRTRLWNPPRWGQLIIETAVSSVLEARLSIVTQTDARAGADVVSIELGSKGAVQAAGLVSGHDADRISRGGCRRRARRVNRAENQDGRGEDVAM